MKSFMRCLFIFAFSIVFSILISVFVSSGDTMTVEANIFSSVSAGEIIRVEVPDYLFFGNLTKGEKSEEMKVYINNTGDVAVSVKPVLTEDDEIFENLYFRELKTSNGTDVPFRKLGNFEFNITRPSSNGIVSKYVYTILDLTNYNQEIASDLIGHQANVKFMAVKQ